MFSLFADSLAVSIVSLSVAFAAVAVAAYTFWWNTRKWHEEKRLQEARWDEEKGRQDERWEEEKGLQKMRFLVRVGDLDTVIPLAGGGVTNRERLPIRITNVGNRAASIDTIGLHLDSGARSEESPFPHNVVQVPDDFNNPLEIGEAREASIDAANLVLWASGEGIGNSSELNRERPMVVVTAHDGTVSSEPLPRWLGDWWNIPSDAP